MRTLHLTSPHMRGQDVKDAQWLLQGHNRFQQSFAPGKDDGQFGPATAAATKRAKWALGYPKKDVNGVFGPHLYKYLLPKTHNGWQALPPTFLARRKLRRVKRKPSYPVKARATNLALANLGYHEAGYSNLTKFGQWYGLNGEPWCAMFVSYCFYHAGSKIFKPGFTAWAYGPEQAARNGHPKLLVTSEPVRGDLVIYHFAEGHIGIFIRWVDRAKGTFEAVEGNTSAGGGSQNNGGAVARKTRDFSLRPTFIRVEE